MRKVQFYPSRGVETGLGSSVFGLLFEELDVEDLLLLILEQVCPVSMAVSQFGLLDFRG